MALIKSPVWSEVRGSIGGTTYARNKTGQYARNRSKPVNPNTVNQSRVRSQFQTSAFGFSLLTVAQVAAWNQFAQGYPAVNRVGDTYTPSGRQMYMLCNQNLQSIGLPPISAPPYDVPVIPNCDISGLVLALITDPGPPLTLSDTGGIDVSGITSDNADALIVIQATPPMQPARQSYRNRMRYLDRGPQGSLISVTTEFNGYFGTPTVTPGQIINFRFSAVDVLSGIASAWMYAQATIPEPLP